MPVRRTPPRFCVEPLEDRVTPAVTAVLNNGTLTVTLSAPGDAATITGIDTTGRPASDLEVLEVFDGTTTQEFAGVTALIVVDGGSNTGQSLTLADDGADTDILLAGAITINNIETVTVETADSILRALSVGVGGATDITLASNVTTTGTGGQVYGGPVTIRSVAGVILDAGASGGVTFSQTVNGSAAAGDDALTVVAGSAATPTQFLGAVGATTPLGSLTTDAGGSTLVAVSVRTVNGQQFNDPVTVSASLAAFTSDTAGVTFAGTLNGATASANGVVVNAPGTTRFGAAVGGVIPLTSVTTDTAITPAGTTEVAATVVTTSTQLYNDDVVVTTAPALGFTSTGAGAITFAKTLTGAVAVTVNTGGQTRFTGDVGGGGAPLLSLTTDAPGTTVVGGGTVAATVTTTGAQTFNDALTLNAPTATFASTEAGAILFAGTVNGTSAATTALVVNSAGTTTFGGIVGATASLLSVATDAPGTTVLANSITTSSGQSYADPVTLTPATAPAPATGPVPVTLNATNGSITFGGAITGTVPVVFTANARQSGTVTLAGPVSLSAAGASFTARAGVDVSVGADVTLSGSGSAFSAQAGGSGAGGVVIPAGRTIRADAQSYKAGDGTGNLTTAVVNLIATAPQLRNAAGTGAPVSFILRQDESISDTNIPAAAQFGGSFPRSMSLASDDGSVTLATTAIAGPETTEVLLSANLGVSVQTAINAPAGTVRLRSGAATVAQTAAGTITAAALGVSAATGIDLTLAPNAATTLALRSTSNAVAYRTAAPVTVGTVVSDSLTALFPTTTGAQATSGALDLAPFGTTALDLTVAAPLAGTAVTVTGGAGADRVTVNYALGATLTNGLAFTGGDGTDTLVLTDAGATAAHTYTVGATVVRDTNTAITLPGVENLSVTGGDTADTFTVTPDTNHTITVAGGGPATGTGDSLTVVLTGATSPVLSATRTPSGLQGTATFADRAAVAFGGIESLTPSADVRVTATGPAEIKSGETGTLTVTVTNTGPTAVTGVSLVDAIPAGFTATWTAAASAGSSVAATSGTGNINTTSDLAVNGTVTFTIRLTAGGGARGSVTNTFTAGSSASAFELDSTNNTATTTIATGPTDLIAVGAGPGGGPVVVAYNPDGTERFRKFAFDLAYSGGVTAATGDVNGDGFEDVVAGSAVGASRITVFDGRTGGELATFFAFPGFTGGVNVAVAGGKIVAGAGVGGGPVVAMFTLTPTGVQEVARFAAFDSNFRGGVQVGGSEKLLVVGAGPGGGPHVKAFDATTLAQTASFFAFPVGSTDGVTVAAGGTTAAPTIIVGSGLGSPPTAATFDANTLAGVGSFQAFESTFRGGVRVAAGGIVNNKTTTVVAPGGGGSSRVRIVAADNTTVRDFFAFESAFTGGVYVG